MPSRHKPGLIALLVTLTIALSIVSSRYQIRYIYEERIGSAWQRNDGTKPVDEESWNVSHHVILPKKRAYPNEGVQVGFISNLPNDYFRELQRRIDEDDNHKRCARYGFTYNETSVGDSIEGKIKRRIFFGALVASEPWELFEIVGAETYGIYEGIVLVESNRTQNFTPRNVTHLDHAKLFGEIYGVDKVQVRLFSNENPKLLELNREQEQRAEILRGWKELGMRPEDLGFLSDADETMTRDFLRAIQVCDGVDMLDYEKHHCNHKEHGIRAKTLVFETSPECVTKGRSWFHPCMFVGACIEEIGNQTFHPKAPRRNGFLRAEGFGYEGDWSKEDKITDNRYHLYNAADFRRVGGAKFTGVNDGQKDSPFGRYSGFHFHNFFTTQNDIRFKYRTYGHANRKAYEQTLSEIADDLNLMVRCVKNMPDVETKNNPVDDGFEGIQRFRPIYFHDPMYRRQRHDFIRELVSEDEKHYAELRNLSAASKFR